MQNKLPNGWKELPLGKLISQKKERYCADIPDDVEIFSVTNEEGFVRSEEFFKKQVFSKDITCYKIVRKGDFAYNPSRINVGSVALLSDIEIATVSPIYEVFRPNENIIGEYLLYFLKSRVGLNLINHYSEGAVRHSLKYDGLSRIPIPLPPLPLQQKIVEILEEAHTLRKPGRKADEKMKALPPSLFVEMCGDPATNPKGWDMKKLTDVCKKITDGAHNSPPLVEDGIPYITAKHVKESGLSFDIDPTFISEDDHKKIYTRCDPELNDVLYIKDGATTGIAATNKYPFQFSMLSSLALLKPNYTLITSEYLNNWLNYPSIKKMLLIRMSGAAITRFTITKLKEFPILLHPLPLQQEFAERVKEIEAEKQRQAKSKKKLDELFNSLMQRAFNGEVGA